MRSSGPFSWWLPLAALSCLLSGCRGESQAGAAGFGCTDAGDSGPSMEGLTPGLLAGAPTGQITPFDTVGMVFIPGGLFQMGGPHPQARPDEMPGHPVRVDGFWMDATEVPHAAFARFVAATGYVTTAERPLDLAALQAQMPSGTPLPPDIDTTPFALVFYRPPAGRGAYGPADWWKPVKGASWRHPRGPDSGQGSHPERPAVQLSWYDAAAYCRWAGKRLPTEAEWEYAARSGLEGQSYPWGNEPLNAGRANYWQGNFPTRNEGLDGFEGPAPVKSFPANGYGLYDMSGNVWEWTADWYCPDYYALLASLGRPAENPRGPMQSYDPAEPGVPKKVVRGGSFLCNDSYCSGYRVSARMYSSPDTGLEHTGCRCVRDAQ
jgi:formylglycine-generating enzyme